MRRYGWAPRGERCRVAVPHGHWKTTTVTLEDDDRHSRPTHERGGRHGPVRRGDQRPALPRLSRRHSDLADTLIPVLKRGDTVILDNLGAHKVAGVRETIHAAGVKLLYLPPYSQDLNPIEQVFAKLKADLRKAAARTLPDLKAAIRSAFDRLTPKACRNCIAAAGYDAFDPT